MQSDYILKSTISFYLQTSNGKNMSVNIENGQVKQHREEDQMVLIF